MDGSGNQNTASTSHALKSPSPIVQIESTTGGGALVTQEDGTITAVDHAHLHTQRTAKLEEKSSSIKILGSQSMSLQEAQLSVLKSRQDLLSSFAGPATVIAAVCEKTSTKGLWYGLWSLSAAHQSQPTATLVLWHELQMVPTPYGKRTSIQFRADTKQLRIDTPAISTTFDLTTIIPQKLSEHKAVVADVLSSLAVTPEIQLVLGSGKLQLFNTRFDAILATRTFTSQTLKRKRDADGNSTTFLIAYFAQIPRVLAYSGNQLLSIDMHSSDAHFKQSSRLSSNMLRGDRCPQTERPTADYSCSIGRVRPDKRVNDSAIILEELDRLAEQRDASGFASRFTQAYHITHAKDLNLSTLGEKSARYLLSKLFSFAGDVKEALRVDLRADELLKMCIDAGLVDRYRIAQALQVPVNEVQPDAVAQAVLAADSSLELVHHYITHAPVLEAETLSSLIATLVRRVRSENEIDAPRRFAGQEGSALPLASHEHALAPQAKESSAVTSCLVAALRRFAFTGHGVVSKEVRKSSFGQEEVITLIQFLRQQLFLGGYYRFGGGHHDPGPATTEEGQPAPFARLSLQAIVTLLNGCIDAIGPVGILGAAEEEEFLRQMVGELLTEVSSAGDAVQDATDLQGLVRETLRYAESVERQPLEVRSQVEKLGSTRTWPSTRTAAQGQIVTLYTEAESTDIGLSSRSALPLSLKAEEDIDRIKVRRGRQSRHRSAREIGMLRDRLKSPYSFERLVL